MKKMIRGFVILLAGLVAGVMIIPALASTPLFSTSDESKMISEQEVINIALNYTEETFEVISIELDDDDEYDDVEYELELRSDSKKVDVEIDAYTGKVKEWDEEIIVSKSNNNQLLSIEDVKKIALDRAGSGYVVAKVELDDDDDDDDDKEYELKLKSDAFEIEVEIDAYSGEIKKWEAKAIKTTTSQQKQTQLTIISKERAIQIAMAKAGSGFKVIEVELDDDDDDREYEIELRSDTQIIEAEIDAYTGVIKEWEVETLKKVSTTKPTMITREQAIAIAREKIGNAPTLEEIELDDDDGRMVYELEFEYQDKEYEFEIDAYTGEILEFEIDD